METGEEGSFPGVRTGFFPARGHFFPDARSIIPYIVGQMPEYGQEIQDHVHFNHGIVAMRTDQDAAQSERVSLAYRRLANAMILSTLREISKTEEVAEEVMEVDFVESPRIDPWCELAGLEPEVVRRAARRLLGVRVVTA